MMSFIFFGAPLPNVPYHKQADAYGRKCCAHSDAKKGHRAKLKAKNRKKRKMRNKF